MPSDVVKQVAPEAHRDLGCDRGDAWAGAGALTRKSAGAALLAPSSSPASFPSANSEWSCHSSARRCRSK